MGRVRRGGVLGIKCERKVFMKKKLRTKKLSKKVGKKSAQKKKYPLRGKLVIYRDAFKSADNDGAQVFPRVPGIDKGKVVIMPDFDDPLEEFEE